MSKVKRKTRKKYSIQCKVCGKIFPSASASSKYCSDKCRKNAYKCICKRCGKEFTSSSSYNQYCSDECRNKAVVLELTCKVCNKSFESYSNTKYCSFKCRELEKQKREENKTKKITKSNYKDIVEFTVKEIINKGISARDNCGVSKTYYARGFNSDIKTKVQERDKYTCRICGKTNSLEVHHIEKVKHGGSSDLDNLITLCVSCHRAVDTLDMDYAIKKCIRNAEKYLGLEYKKEQYSLKDRVDISLLELNAVYNRLSRLSDDIEIEELMIKLNDIIEGLQDSLN